MSTGALQALAERAGLATQWTDYRGEPRSVDEDIIRSLLEALELVCRSPQQIRESLALLDQEDAGATEAAPQETARCFTVHDLVGERRLWGLGAQIYALRRENDGGIGDFTALAHLARAAAAQGADAIAVSPLHALFSADLGRFSPYSPSSRLFLNVLHADPAEAFGEARVSAMMDCATAKRRAALEAEALIDWPNAARAKLELARLAYAQLAGSPALRDDFETFRETSGAALRDHARFETLHAHFKAQHWREWPQALQDSDSAEVQGFAQLHADEVRFHAFLQWLADRGLARAQTAAREAGMAIGLIGDLAVGTDSGGSHAWSRRHDMLIGVSIGAPPDALNGLGQNWGLSAFSPRALRRRSFEPFIEMLRAQLRHSGGLRIDHVLGFNRLWLIPDGAEPTQGAYLRYPLREMLRLTAIESRKARAVIVGEDMGTVPEGFRERLNAAQVLGIRVLWFERDWGLFVEPERWPRSAAAMTTTHDLPTVAGWWRGRDIDWRARLKLYGPGSDEAGERRERVQDRRRLWSALVHSGAASGSQPADEDSAAVVDAAAAHVASAPSPLMLLPLEDALGEIESPNIPGTIDEHPNWRRRLQAEPDALLQAPEVSQRLRTVNEARRRKN